MSEENVSNSREYLWRRLGILLKMLYACKMGQLRLWLSEYALSIHKTTSIQVVQYAGRIEELDKQLQELEELKLGRGAGK